MKGVGATGAAEMPAAHTAIMEKIGVLYRDLFFHNGFGELKVTMRFLKKGQKEIIIACGKEYRFVVDFPGNPGG